MTANIADRTELAQHGGRKVSSRQPGHDCDTYERCFSPARRRRARDSTSGIATGDQPEGIYDVLDGTHYDAGCCFDYGNAETNNDHNGDGDMEAVYFGNIAGPGGT